MTDTDVKNVPSYSKVLIQLLKGPITPTTKTTGTHWCSTNAPFSSTSGNWPLTST